VGFNFPPTPNEGESYTSGGITFVWNGYGWMLKAPDAPVDGKIYGRKNATWAEIISDVTKSYVDTQDAAITANANSRVLRAGDTMTGTLNITNGDLRSSRAGGTTGVLYLSTGDRFLYWNGSKFELNGDTTIAGQMTSNYVIARGEGDRMRWRGDVFSVISHINNDDWYLMLTDTWATDSGWNGLRPFRINRASGNVVMSHNVNVGSLDGGTIATHGTTLGGRSYWSTTYGGQSSALEVRSGSADWDAYMSFHIPNSFACNFGLKYNNWKLWYGGVSFGQGNEWQIWSTRNFGHWQDGCVTNLYMSHCADTWPDAGNIEPWAGAVITGYNTNHFRWRWSQFWKDGAWRTAGT